MKAIRPESKDPVRSAAGWVEQRTGATSLWNSLFARKIPLGVGYWYTIGFATLFVFVLQAATGIFLSMYYAPSPDHAYDSIQFIMYQVPFGAVVRGIHHWGASAMVVLAVVHMAVVFVLGAYKYPRELTWMVGVGLLVLTLGFGFTGYLLPWDEKAFWATQVGTNMPGTLPVIGDFVTRILRGGTELGVLTLARFFSLHTMLLPTALGGLVLVKLYLVVYHGVSVPPSLWDRVPTRVRGLLGAQDPFAKATGGAASPEEEYHERYDEFKRRGPTFWPSIVLEDTIMAALVLVAILVLTVTQGVVTEAPADPTNTAYVPRPEWYFMFLFQSLKYFPGNLEWVAVAVVPTVGLLLLLFLPVYDRSPWRSAGRRPIAMAIGLLAAAGIAFLTYAAYQ